MENVKASKKEIQGVIENLKNGAIYQNDVAGYQFILKADGTRIAYINGKYCFYKNLEAFAAKIVKLQKAG